MSSQCHQGCLQILFCLFLSLLRRLHLVSNNFYRQRCSCDLKLDPQKTNPNGGAVGLGHPIGATGAVLTVKALYELQRIGGRYALVTMCIGGGQGIAAVFERLQ